MTNRRRELRKEDYPSPLKLHLGCFNRPFAGYVNVDARADTAADVVDDFRHLTKFDNDSADLIVCIHALEHTTFKESFEVLQRWHQVLKPGGTVRISVPDMLVCAKWLIDTGDLNAVRTMYWGSQAHPFDFHYHGWTFDSLKTDLNRAGFCRVRTWDHKTVEHGHVDSYAAAYLPRGDAVNGVLMSLNVEADKPRC